MAKGKTWKEKMRIGEMQPQVVPVEGAKALRMNANTMLLPTPSDVASVMSEARPGQVITVKEIQQTLARRHNADTTCPMMTGIFIWIASQAAEEAKANGETNDLPWWRTIKSDGSLNPKYPGGIERQRCLLESEGITVQPTNKVKFQKVD